MSLTLSHYSALSVIRTLRSEGLNLQDFDGVPLASPSTWVGNRWSKREFDSRCWKWDQPCPERPLDIVLPSRKGRVRMANVQNHTIWQELPSNPALWLDEHSRIVCPELLFLQIAEIFPLPTLVLLGYELCGFYSRSASNPRSGPVVTNIPTATSVERLGSYLSNFSRATGLARAWEALRYVSNDALSAPEGLLATMYSLPVRECGYGMGPITLNKRVGPSIGREGEPKRYPDILFPFAPVGINYDGQDHLDLGGLVDMARAAERATGDEAVHCSATLDQKIQDVRAKAYDDGLRNRQLAARGHLVVTATKEDLMGYGHLDALTRDILAIAKTYFGTNVSAFEAPLENTEQTRDRNALLSSLLPSGRTHDSAHDLM